MILGMGFLPEQKLFGVCCLMGWLDQESVVRWATVAFDVERSGRQVVCQEAAGVRSCGLFRKRSADAGIIAQWFGGLGQRVAQAGV